MSLETANAVLVNGETSLVPEFADDAAKKYFGYAGKLERHDPWKKVNDFVARKTNNNIKDLIQEGIEISLLPFIQSRVLNIYLILHACFVYFVKV